MSHLTWILQSYQKLNNTFIRFLAVGLLNTFVGLSITIFFLNVIELNYWGSTFIGISVGAVVSYLLNRSFTFKSKAPLLKSSLQFIAIIFICYLTAYSLGIVLAELIFPAIRLSAYLSYHELSVIFGSIFYTMLNYLGQKWLVFNVKKGTV